MDPYHSYWGVEWYYFVIIWAFIALGSHIYQVGFIVRLIRLGRDDDRFNSWQQRTTEFLTDWLGQRKVVEDKIAGYAHALIFWGFLMLVSDVVDLSTGGALYKFLKLRSILLGNIWNLIVDIGYTMAGIGIIIALYRRIVIKPEKLKDSSIEGILILFAILGIVLTAFIVEAGYMLGENIEYNNWEPIGVLFAKQMVHLNSDTLGMVIDVSYWLHMILIGGFLIEIPQTKHSHLIGTIPNVMFQDHSQMGAMKPLQIDNEGLAVKTDDLDFDNLAPKSNDKTGIGLYKLFIYALLIIGFSLFRYVCWPANSSV